MSDPQIKLKILSVRKEAGNVVAQELESNEEVTLNISPKIKKSNIFPEEGKEYWCRVNENWLNYFQSVEGKVTTSNQTTEPKPQRMIKNDYWEQRAERDVETQKDILVEHYSTDACRLLAELYRTKDIKDINEQELIRYHFNLTEQLIESHKTLKKKLFEE